MAPRVVLTMIVGLFWLCIRSLLTRTGVHDRWRPVVLLRRALPLEELEGFILGVAELERRHSHDEVVRGQRYIYMHTYIHTHTCIHDIYLSLSIYITHTHTHTHTHTWRVPHGAIGSCGVITAKLHLGLVLGGEERELPLELRRCQELNKKKMRAKNKTKKVLESEQGKIHVKLS
jgi:hypothetical protein